MKRLQCGIEIEVKDQRCPLRMPRPSIFSPHMTNSRDLVWMTTLLILIMLKRPIFKNHTRANRLPMVKIQNYWPIYGKMPLDNKAAIRYMNSGHGIIMKIGVGFPDLLHIAIRQIIEHNRKLGLLSVPQSEFLSFKRTQTIASGASWCDFRFKKTWNTPRGWPPEELGEEFLF